MRRREGLRLAGTVGVALLAGCAAPRERGEPADPTTTRFVGRVLAVSAANETSVADAPADRKARYADLSDAEREEFRRALEGDVREPTAWTPGTDVEYVRYEGTWYWVTVVVAN